MRNIMIKSRKGNLGTWTVVFVLSMVAIVLGCSTNSIREVATVEPSAPLAQQTPLEEEGRRGSTLEIQSVDIEEGAEIARITVATTGALVWTTYRDAEQNLVIELPNSSPSAAISSAYLSDGLIESVDLRLLDTGLRPLTSMVVKTRADTEHSIKAGQGFLEIDFSPTVNDWAANGIGNRGEATVAMAESPAGNLPETVAEIELAPPASTQVEMQRPAENVFRVDGSNSETPVPSLRPAASRLSQDQKGPAATQLQNIEVTTEDGVTVVNVLGDGHFFYSTFALENPDRYVVDVIGVLNNAPLAAVAVENGLVNQVRVAQFKSYPELVSRVVVDLEKQTVPQVTRRSDGLALAFSEQAPTTFAEDLTAIMETPNGSLSDEPPADIVAELNLDAEPPPMPTYPEESVYDTRQTFSVADDDAGMGASDIGTAPTAGLPALSPAAGPSYGSRPVEVANDATLYGGSGSAVAPGEPRDGEVKSLFDSQAATNNQRNYLGAPMTITVKDADIKDILRSFAEISGLNVVVQPGVSGRVTVELKDVPWDQALEQILKINRLGYQLEGNIMRIAPVSQLQQEAEEQQRLRQAEALAVPLRTVIRRVSYAGASEIATLLKSGGAASVMSRRGTVIVDQRTNTLIIKEIPGFMDVVIAVIETLDTPEPQVLIEARIIETTKRYNSTLGINWGFNGVADAVHGNTTGLLFPNNIAAAGGVNLATGGANGFLDLALGNVLNSFTLDAALQAAESEGLINVLSAPRVTTLNNQSASIQSGLQIPIQTVANNTVSVQFVNATLRLQVTPHVTAEGTVLMDINIQKREPQLAFAIVGATNAPIATKEARTRVIVRDGGTTVIGGIYNISSDRGEDRVPGLSNIPILKHLFKNKRRNDENEELLIFITPRVVKL